MTYIEQAIREAVENGGGIVIMSQFYKSTDRLEEKVRADVDENTSDGYHTFKELYEYRLLYNAAFFNSLASGHAHGFAVKHDVHKSKKHSDGEDCFGGGWFIVVAQLPTGQISNHYELKDWDLFNVPERERAAEWDGHTPKDVADRLREYLTPVRSTAPLPMNEKKV